MNDARRQGLTADTVASTFVVGAISFYVDWIAEWLRFAEEHPKLVVLSYFDELTDLQAMMARVFDELGASWLGEVPTALTDHDRYRQKRRTGWRIELTADAQEYVELRVRAELQDVAAFERLWND